MFQGQLIHSVSPMIIQSLSIIDDQMIRAISLSDQLLGPVITVPLLGELRDPLLLHTASSMSNQREWCRTCACSIKTCSYLPGLCQVLLRLHLIL